ncbi:MAG: tetratricopeptide repeat protein [Holosporaceae bacterium]|nr:tetratricopeptide repeat protein [Holosporaceae bacterium]
MKKFLLLSVLLVDCLFAEDRDVEEDLRELRGRIEKIEQTLSLQQSISEEKAKDATTSIDVGVIAGKTPEQIIEISLDRMWEGDFRGARQILQAYIVQNSGSLFMGMMLFGVGNTYAAEKDYQQAAVKYMEGFKKNPRGAKAAETLYRLAMCFNRLEQQDRYISTLKKIIQDYPGEWKVRANELLKATPKQ